MREVTTAFETAIENDSIFPFMLAEIEDTEGTLYVWSGYGELIWNDNTYIGLAGLGQVSNLEEVETLYASGVTLGINGVPSSLVSVALQEITQGKEATLYLGLLDPDAQTVVSDPSLVFRGLIDVPTLTDTGEASTLELTVESELIRLESAGNATYTPYFQKVDYPGDDGFNFVAGLVEQEIDFGA